MAILKIILSDFSEINTNIFQIRGYDVAPKGETSKTDTNFDTQVTSWKFAFLYQIYMLVVNFTPVEGKDN